MRTPLRAFALALFGLLAGCDDAAPLSPEPTADAGLTDSSVDGPDQGVTDASLTDAAPAPDALILDAGASDAATPDAALPDAAPPIVDPSCASADALIAEFYAVNGPRDAFSAQVVAAFEAFLRAEEAVCRGDMPAAAALLDALWARYPLDDPGWNAAFNPGRGVNLGTPAGYYGLRMLQEIVDTAAVDPPTTADVRLTVVEVGCSTGIQPRTRAELRAGEGVEVRHDLDPALLADDQRLVRESLDLFGRYVSAMTLGRLRLVVDIVVLPEVCVPVSASEGDLRFATVGSLAPMWAALDPALVARTDWWMAIYPSHVPEQHPELADLEYITGGMGRAAAGGPLFIADDRWIVRKPPHLGDGLYTDAERRVYLPQWLQHEFFHHLFQIFPEHALEAQSHQWFDRRTWPDDFEGRYEPDYYAEALHRRLRDSVPPLHARLRYAIPVDAFADVPRAAVLGEYTREPVLNDWHIGRIIDDDGLAWVNTAGVRWSLGDAIATGRLTGGPDNPYAGDVADIDFHLRLMRDADGALLPQILGFTFGGELYRRTGP